MKKKTNKPRNRRQKDCKYWESLLAPSLKRDKNKDQGDARTSVFGNAPEIKLSNPLDMEKETNGKF